MNNKKRFIVIVLLVLLLLGAVYIYLMDMTEDNLMPAEAKRSETAEQADGNEKTMAPDFTVLDAEGNEVKLSDCFGKPVVLNFWASWCGPCRMEMPDFDEAYLQYGDEVNFLMVNLTDGSTETVETAESFISESGYSFPIYFDTKQEAVYAYYVSAIPATYFIDKDGFIAAGVQGAINAQTLMDGLDMIME